jgi:hypothetical protein
MDRRRAQEWLDRDLIGTRDADRAHLHVGNLDPHTAEQLRIGLVAQQETIESVRARIAAGEFGE